MIGTDKEKAFKYLLGDLTESERDAVEERFFADENFSRLMDDAENDLVDEFLRGELSTREAQLFSSNYLVSERRHEKVRAAQILQNELFAESASTNFVSTVEESASFWTTLARFFRAPQIAFAALAILLLLFGAWFGLRNRETRDVVEIIDRNSSPTPDNIQPPLPSNSLSNKATTISNTGNTNSNQHVVPPANKTVNANKPKSEEKKPVERIPKSSPVQTTLASMILFPATRSSAQSPTLTLKPNVKAVNLQIVNDRVEDFDRFRVEVRNIDGALISSQDFKNTNYKRKNFVLQVPAAKLAPADYQITLKGADSGNEFQNLNYFYFSIEKK